MQLKIGTVPVKPGTSVHPIINPLEFKMSTQRKQKETDIRPKRQASKQSRKWNVEDIDTNTWVNSFHVKRKKY